MLIEAWGAKSAILSTSSGFSSLPSTLTMSFVPSCLLGTCIAINTIPLVRLVIPRIFTTSNACPPVMWSMTVPSLIFETRRVVSAIYGLPLTQIRRKKAIWLFLAKKLFITCSILCLVLEVEV